MHCCDVLIRRRKPVWPCRSRSSIHCQVLKMSPTSSPCAHRSRGYHSTGRRMYLLLPFAHYRCWRQWVSQVSQLWACAETHARPSCMPQVAALWDYSSLRKWTPDQASQSVIIVWWQQVLFEWYVRIWCVARISELWLPSQTDAHFTDLRARFAHNLIDSHPLPGLTCCILIENRVYL